jgi:hypothetical protein
MAVQAFFNKLLIDAPAERDRVVREMYIFYDFIYFYAHLTVRHACAQLPEPQIQDLQACLGPHLSRTAIDSYCAHWPDDIKLRMFGEFYDRLNEAERKYAECTAGIKGFVPVHEALLATLASKVSLLVVHGENCEAVKLRVSQIAVVVLETATKEWAKMRLDDLLAEIKKYAESNPLWLKESGSSVTEWLASRLKEKGW